MPAFAKAVPENEIFPAGSLRNLRRHEIYKICIEQEVLTSEHPTPTKDVMIAMLNGEIPAPTKANDFPAHAEKTVTLASAHTDNPVEVSKPTDIDDLF